jgi:hypothetical protein
LFQNPTDRADPIDSRDPKIFFRDFSGRGLLLVTAAASRSYGSLEKQNLP